MKQANNKLKPLKVNNNLQKINLTFCEGGKMLVILCHFMVFSSFIELINCSLNNIS